MIFLILTPHFPIFIYFKREFPCRFLHIRTPVVDFDWKQSESDPCQIVSVSDDSLHEDFGGGTLQFWRISDLIWRPFDDVVREVGALPCVRKFVF